MTKAWFSFEHSVLRAPSGPLSQETCDQIFSALPTTGCAWIEGGRLFVQQNDGAIAWDCGEVAEGVTAARFRDFDRNESMSAEREECAVTAERLFSGHGRHYVAVGKAIANAIRARGGK